MDQTVSAWMGTGEIPSESRLTADIETNVCIVGAGIAGLSTAYLLLQEGRSVVVLDDGPIGGGQTERTTAHLSNAIDARYVQIENWHGVEGARLAAESHSAAIDRIESIVARESIDCDFERLAGYLFNPPGEAPDLLERELQAARRAGLNDVEVVLRSPLGAFDTGPSLRFPQQGQLHPLKYMAGLVNAIRNQGGKIFTQTHVDKIQHGPPARVHTREGATVSAGSVVVATNSPFNDLVTIHTKQAAYLTYALGFAVPRGAIHKALYWDTQTPYHYVRLMAMPKVDSNGNSLGNPQSEELLIVGGEDHKTGQSSDASARYPRLEEWTRARFPEVTAIRCHWSGQVLETIDGLAFIGRNPLDGPNVYIATGDSGQGMTHGTIAGILLTDLIVGRKNSWAALYDPERKSLRAAGRFLRESVNVALQYSDWITPGNVASIDDIAPGAGAVVRRGLTKMAACRDDQGMVYKFSAICPHLGCVVQWNPGENSWDCPCHGSRFDKQGRLLCGPANTDLTPIFDVS